MFKSHIETDVENMLRLLDRDAEKKTREIKIEIQQTNEFRYLRNVISLTGGTEEDIKSYKLLKKQKLEYCLCYCKEERHGHQ